MNGIRPTYHVVFDRKTQRYVVRQFGIYGWVTVDKQAYRTRRLAERALRTLDR